MPPGTSWDVGERVTSPVNSIFESCLDVEVLPELAVVVVEIGVAIGEVEVVLEVAVAVVEVGVGEDGLRAPGEGPGVMEVAGPSGTGCLVTGVPLCPGPVLVIAVDLLELERAVDVEAAVDER